MTDINAITVRFNYFLEQVKRLGTQEACMRYILRDPQTLRELSFEEKAKLAGMQENKKAQSAN